MSIPAWLKRLLSEQNPDGITRRIRARRCTKCAAITLRGLDGDVAALPARVDPEPISADGELAALLTGRRTYTLRTDGDRLQLDHARPLAHQRQTRRRIRRCPRRTRLRQTAAHSPVDHPRSDPSRGDHVPPLLNEAPRCPCCAQRKPDLGIACSTCRDLSGRRLSDLLELYALTEGELVPGRGGSRSTGRGLGLRIDALDFVTGHDILPRLEVWERDWRETRSLSAQPSRGNLAGLPNAVATLSGVVDFLTVHLTWAYSEHEAVDEFHGDLAMLHGQARRAARVASPHVSVITCPADGGKDGRCGHELVLHDLDLEGSIDAMPAARCGTCAACCWSQPATARPRCGWPRTTSPWCRA